MAMAIILKEPELGLLPMNFAGLRIGRLTCGVPTQLQNGQLCLTGSKNHTDYLIGASTEQKRSASIAENQFTQLGRSSDPNSLAALLSSLSEASGERAYSLKILDR